MISDSNIDMEWVFLTWRVNDCMQEREQNWDQTVSKSALVRHALHLTPPLRLLQFGFRPLAAECAVLMLPAQGIGPEWHMDASVLLSCVMICINCNKSNSGACKLLEVEQAHKHAPACIQNVWSAPLVQHAWYCKVKQQMLHQLASCGTGVGHQTSTVLQKGNCTQSLASDPLAALTPGLLLEWLHNGT